MNPRMLRHDIRGALNTIRLSVEVLRIPPGSAADDAPDASRFLDTICREVARIDRLLAGASAAAGPEREGPTPSPLYSAERAGIEG